MGQIGVLFAFAVVAGLVWFLWRTFHEQPASGPTVAWSDPNQHIELVGRDSTGSVRWTYRFPAAVDRYGSFRDILGWESDYPAPGEGQLHRLWRLIRQREHREGMAYSAEFDSAGMDGRMASFDLATGLRWEMPYSDLIGPLARRVPRGWTLQSHFQFAAGSRKTVLLFRHTSRWPSAIVVLNDSGAVLGRFAHAGPLTDMRLDDHDARNLRVVAVGNSASRQAAVVVLLDALSVSGSSPEEPGSTYECRECGSAGSGQRYFVFPRSEVEVAGSLPLPEMDADGWDSYEGGFTYFFGRYGIGYVVSADYERGRVDLGDEYWRRHQELESAGRITHSRERCPEKDGPRSIRAWSAAGWRDVPMER